MKIITSILWAIVTGFIITVGISFSFQLHFPQLKFRKMFRVLTKPQEKNQEVSMFSSFMMVLGGRIGVGSIAGVALAIYIGGPGSIFWMWVSTLFSSVLSYVETYLGMKYQQKDGHLYKGGPAYYMKYGLKAPKLGGIYALIILICYICGFLGIQANTIQKSLTSLMPISKYTIAIILIMIVFLIIIRGVKGISELSGKLVPVMTIFYLGITGYFLIIHPSNIISITSMIFHEAFHFSSIVGGLLPTIMVGIQRGIFSNEGGLGTGSIASSVIQVENPKDISYLQSFGVYVTTLLICTLTAYFILSTPYQTLRLADVNGIEMVQFAFSHHFGAIGPILLSLSIFFFSFSTILTGYYYGESCMKYFKNGNKPSMILGLKLFTLVFLFIGTVISSTALWGFIDCFVAVVAIMNICAMYYLRKEVS